MRSMTVVRNSRRAFVRVYTAAVNNAAPVAARMYREAARLARTYVT